MQRSFEIAIAILALSLWLLGKQGVGLCMTIEKALIVCAVSYYIFVKVFAQMIFRCRMSRNGVALMPYWFPFIGNFVAFAKSYLKREKDNEQLG